MTKQLSVDTCGPISATVRVPGSKSITNRALLCAALAYGRSTLAGVLDSEDTRLMVDALRELGITIDVDWSAARAGVVGSGGPFEVKAANLHVGNSGTTMRFLSAAVSLGSGRYRLSGTSRMHLRPIGDLIDALRQLGVRAEAESPGDCPPVVIDSTGWRGGEVTIATDVSSQFVSGLMMSAPYATRAVTLKLVGRIISQPYIRLTAEVMSAFGARVDIDGATIKVSNEHRYVGREFRIEPDATAASYFLAAAAVAGGTIRIQGLDRQSNQGDLRFAECLSEMGCQVDWQDQQIVLTGPATRGIDVDMRDISDTVQTLAVVALFVDGPTIIRGVAHIRHKESDRIGDLSRELRKLGAKVDEYPDGLKISPAALRGATIDTYNDHRMAMSLAIAGLKIPGVIIRDPECVAKTYPRYFQDLANVTQHRRQS